MKIRRMDEGPVGAKRSLDVPSVEGPDAVLDALQEASDAHPGVPVEAQLEGGSLEDWTALTAALVSDWESSLGSKG
jgi:hypothetical protein